jgi:hypothetical protein
VQVPGAAVPLHWHCDPNGDAAVMAHLYTSSDLKQYRLIAADGDLGSIEDFCVEQWSWAVRYLVVDTGKWLANRKILVSPIAVGNIYDQDSTIDIELTKWQLEHSPVLEQKSTISRQYEDLYHKHLNWAPYWTATEAEPRSLATSEIIAEQAEPDTPSDGENHLKCETELRGFAMRARGQQAGSVDGIIIDSYYWVVRYLIVDVQQWLPAKTIILSPEWITELDWTRRYINVDISGDVMSSAPAYDETQPLSQQYEIDLYKHYGMSYYGDVS